jgi:type I restriction enzyme S subunit
MTVSTLAGKWKPYPAYKPSGVDWLGDVPVHWELRRLKHIFRIINGSTPKSAKPEYWDGDIPWVTPDDLGNLSNAELSETSRNITESGYNSCGTTLVPDGSLVLSTRAPIGHLAIAAVQLCTNQGCRSLVFRGPQHRRFFYYQILAARAELESLGQGSTFRELAADKLASVWLGLPPVQEQERIVAFLDREMAKIDAPVAKKERLIELLQEKCFALITHAVTKGLNPSAPRKDSGVEWLGRIPAHWQVRRLKFLTREVTVGIVVTPAKYYVADGIPCLRSLNVREGTILETDSVFISPQSNEELRKSKIFAGDLVTVRTGQPGATAVVDERFDGANCIDLIITRRSELFHSGFMVYVANSKVAKAQFESRSGGAIQQHFNIEMAKDLMVVVPPYEEQQAIAAWLGDETGKLEELVGKVQEHVERLREYRAALISAAVTGKIDVREEAA